MLIVMALVNVAFRMLAAVCMPSRKLWGAASALASYCRLIFMGGGSHLKLSHRGGQSTWYLSRTRAPVSDARESVQLISTQSTVGTTAWLTINVEYPENRRV